MSYRIKSIVKLSAVGFLSVLSGCGGGGGSVALAPTNSSTRAVLCSDAPTSPNYVTDLQRLLRWRDLPVTVRFTTQTLQGNVFLEELVRQGFGMWVQRSGGGINWQEVSADQNAQVNVRLEMIGSSATRYLGITEVSYATDNNQIRRADMVIYVWPNMTPAEVNRLVGTGAHEFGHALGLLGHSASPNDLMYPSGNAGRGPTESDMNTVRSSYCGGSYGLSADPEVNPETAQERTITIQCPQSEVEAAAE